MITELIAGDTLDFLDVVPDYPASAGWTLKYRLVPRFTTPSQSPIMLTATTSGDDYRVQAAAGLTFDWVPGAYYWARWVEQGAIRQSCGDGELTVLTDPAQAVQGYDARGHAQKVVDAIEAVLENRASKDQEEYTIEGRSLKRTPIAELLVLRDRYRAELARDDAVERIAAGLPNPSQIGVRFVRI